MVRTEDWDVELGGPELGRSPLYHLTHVSHSIPSWAQLRPADSHLQERPSSSSQDQSKPKKVMSVWEGYTRITLLSGCCGSNTVVQLSLGPKDLPVPPTLKLRIGILVSCLSSS